MKKLQAIARGGKLPTHDLLTFTCMIETGLPKRSDRIHLTASDCSSPLIFMR